MGVSNRLADSAAHEIAAELIQFIDGIDAPYYPRSTGANGAAERTVCMPKYVIERELPNAGKMTPDDLAEAARKSNAVLEEMGIDIQWIESYITTDKIYCVYRAKNEDLLREHGKKSGFPVDRIERIHGMNDPTMGE